MAQGPQKSRLVGPAVQDNGHRTTAYKAMEPHTCGACGRTIAPGELFSRRTAYRGPLSPGAHLGGVSLLGLAPLCVTCRPLRLIAADRNGVSD